MRIRTLNGTSHGLFVLLVGLISGGLLSLPLHSSDSAAHVQKLNGGYFLLHALMHDESQVPLLLDIKDAPPEIGSFAVEIGKTGKADLAELERLQDRDPAIRFDQNPLPAIEQETRDSIKSDKQHQLLFGTKDSEFVRRFLLSQTEASTYALNLAKVLADQETDPDRSRVLRHISTQWLAIREKDFRILRNY
jgi:hypothetical protein